MRRSPINAKKARAESMSRNVSANSEVAGLDCVLFDLYGTVLDIQVDEDSPSLWRGLAAALGGTGQPVDPAEVRRRFQMFLKQEAERGREGFLMEPVFLRLLRSLQAGDDVGGIGRLFRELSLKELRLRPYVVPLFERLHRSGRKVAIVSNTEAVLTRFELDRYPILQTADTIVLSSDVGVKKPDPKIFLLALDRLGVGPATAVFIGNDWTADIIGAHEVGLRAIYVNERATESLTATSMWRVVEVAPTLASIVAALRAWGWEEVVP